MENTLVLSQLPAAELAGLIARELRAQMPPQPTAAENTEPDRLRTPKEAAAFFQITEPTLRDWTRREIVKGSRIGGRVRYRHTDLLAALDQITLRRRSQR